MPLFITSWEPPTFSLTPGTSTLISVCSPAMLMELAYRLAVEDTHFIQKIRRDAIVLITPIVETDGHDRMVDIYMQHKKHPDQPPYFFFQAEDGIRDYKVTGVQTCALPICTDGQDRPRRPAPQARHAGVELPLGHGGDDAPRRVGDRRRGGEHPRAADGVAGLQDRKSVV